MEMAQQLMRGCLFLCLLSLGSCTQQQQTCIGSYNSSQGIALLETSFQEGARLLDVSWVNTSLACLERCCSIQDCDLAVLEEGKAGEEHTCILVKCFSEHKPVCTFGPRAGYQSHSRSVSLQKIVDPTATPPVDCLSPAVTGPCRAAFLRWNYDASDKTCREFTYGGCLGNGNNFMSREECTKVCDRVTVNAVPVSLRSVQALKDCSRPCSASEFQCGDGCCISRDLLCDGTSRCFDKSDEIYCNDVYAGYARLTGHQESSPQGNEVIPEPHRLRGNAGGDEYCFAPVVTGNCRAAFPRWYYDRDSQRCQRFIYGGCGGNKNNYETEAECLATCAEQCNAPKKVGKCRASFPRWYFDTQTQSCKKFTYGGCKGNQNNYESEAQCMATCAGHNEVIPGPHRLRGNAGDDEYCYAPVVTGKCRAAFPRWYYDRDSQRCQRFTYGGCGGNKNNYETEAECLATCAGSWKPGNNGETEHHVGIRHHASAILMVVLLSICILVLLMGVIYFIVRLTKTDHIVSYQRAPHGEDKENLINTVQNL